MFRLYFELLEEGSETASLTGARGWERVREELFVRSLRLLTPAPGGFVSTAGWFAQSASSGGQARRVIDVGTGAGIPGLVLKIAAPEMALTLLDANQKKCKFLRKAVAALGLEGVQVLQARAEEAAHDPEHRGSYDLVVSRGVARLAELAELTLPFAAVGGVVISAKGQDVAGEIAESEHVSELLGAAPAIAQEVAAPGAAPADAIVYWLKISWTPRQYPRRTGVPHKRPLLRPAASVPASRVIESDKQAATTGRRGGHQ
jgi:16S rRNA (guanine527-N7)-methyltransferase